MNASLIKEASTADLLTFVNQLKFRTVNHGSDFARRQMLRNIDQINVEIKTRETLSIQP